jgi:hypothetical protein
VDFDDEEWVKLIEFDEKRHPGTRHCFWEVDRELITLVSTREEYTWLPLYGHVQ